MQSIINIYDRPKKERIYCGKDGRRKAPSILTYLALPAILTSLLSIKYM